jgi:LacI family transcriptional regulator
VPTVRDVARLAAVSTASVSRVLSGTAGVSDDVRARVLQAVEELGYRPNAIARSLRMTGTQTFGLVVSDLINPYFAELARAVEDAARASGYSVIVGNADEDPDQQDHYIRILLERQVDGLIVVPTEETSALLHEATERGEAVILVDRPARDISAPTARARGDEAITELIGHLAELGYRSMAVIAGPARAGTSRERLAATRRAAAQFDIHLPETHVRRGDFRVESGALAASDLLDLPVPPEVIFALNGQMGQGVIQEVRRRRIQIPDDVGVCVFDDLPWFDLLDPAITAISQPIADIGALAVHMLLRRLSGEQVADEARPCSLHVRASCGEEVRAHV